MLLLILVYANDPMFVKLNKVSKSLSYFLAKIEKIIATIKSLVKSFGVVTEFCAESVTVVSDMWGLI